MPWFALHVRSNFEKRAASAAAANGREVFFPSYRDRRKLGAVVRLERPLFPGYVFVRLASATFEDRVELLRAPGVVRLVAFAGRPAPIPDPVIDSLRIITQGPVGARPHPLLRLGQAVQVVSGPFAGAHGILEQGRGRKPRLVVAIEILGRAAAVPVDLTDLLPGEG